jgi:WD40 repeat protein
MMRAVLLALSFVGTTAPAATLVDTIDLPGNVTGAGIVVASHGRTAYVTYQTGDVFGPYNIAVVDLGRLDWQSTFPLGDAFAAPPTLWLSPDDSTLFTRNNNGDLFVVDVATETVVDTISVNFGAGIVFEGEGEVFWVRDSDRLMRYTRSPLAQTHSFPIEDGGGGDLYVYLSDDGTEVYTLTSNSSSGGAARVIEVFSTNPPASLGAVTAGTSGTGIALVGGGLSADGTVFFSHSAQDDAVTATNLATGTQEWSAAIATGGEATRVSPDGTRVWHFTNGFLGSNETRVYDAADGTLLQTLPTTGQRARFFGAATPFSPTGCSMLIPAAGTNQLYVVDPETLAITDTLSLPGSPRGLAFSPDGDTAYVLSDDTDLYVIDLVDECQRDAPTLRMEGVCPGPITVEIGNLTPNGPFAIASARNPGNVRATMGVCAGVNTGLNGTIRVRAYGTADASGNALLTPTIRAGGNCPRMASVIDLSTCEVSNVALLTLTP